MHPTAVMLLNFGDDNLMLLLVDGNKIRGKRGKKFDLLSFYDVTDRRIKFNFWFTQFKRLGQLLFCRN